MHNTTKQTWPTLAELDSAADCMGGKGGAFATIDALKDALQPLVNLDISPSIEEGVPSPKLWQPPGRPLPCSDRYGTATGVAGVVSSARPSAPREWIPSFR